MFNQIAKGMSDQLELVLKNASGEALAGYQKLAVIRLRLSPDWYGWTFLILCIFPVARIVVLGSRNLDTISDLLFHKAAASSVWQPNSAQRGSPPSGNSAGRPVVPAFKELSTEDMDKLVRLKRLLDQGAMTLADFEAQKNGVLRENTPVDEPPEAQKLKELLNAGVLTQDEYEVQREHVLSRP